MKEYIEKKDVRIAVNSFICEIISESGVDKNEHTNKVLRALDADIASQPSAEVIPVTWLESHFSDQTMGACIIRHIINEWRKSK